MTIISNLIKYCKYCGKEFRSTIKKRIYCSDDCFKKYQIDRRRKYSRDNKEEIYKRRTTCKYCGERFKKEELKKRCCGREECIFKQKKEAKQKKQKKYYNKNIKIMTKKFKKQKKETSREYRRNNSDEINKRIRGTKKEIREWADSLKQKSECNKCGERRWYCLVYHHLDSKNKRFGIADAVSKGYGKKTIIEEMEKCIVLCSNCHKEIHYEENKRKYEKKTKEQKEKNKECKNKIIKEINERKIKEEEINKLYYSKILYYKMVEEELNKEWIKNIQKKAQNNVRKFKGNQFKKTDDIILEKIDISKAIAIKIGTGKDTVNRSIQIYKRGTEEQKQRVRTGKCSINKIYKELKPIRYQKNS